MSSRRHTPPPPRDGGSASSASYGGGRGGYSDRRPPPDRSYRGDYESRGKRRSVSPPYSRGSHSGRDRRDDRYEGRRDRDYSRDGAYPPPRDERGNRHAAPPPPRDTRDEEYSRRRRDASPPRRSERDRMDEDERGRGRHVESTEAPKSEAKINAEEDEGSEEGGVDPAEANMMAAMGFGGFGTTKGSKVEGNQMGTAEVKKERTWRQYMQRKGGFNRPLSPVRKS